MLPLLERVVGHLERVRRVANKEVVVHAPDSEANELWAQVNAETNIHRKGRRLEDLLELLLRSIPGFIVTGRRRGLDEELDLVVRNESTDPWWSKEGSYLLVESKNWSRPCDPKELAHFLSKLQLRFDRAKLGFFVATGGFTPGFRTTLAARRESSHLVVLVGPDDLQRLVDASDRSSVLKELHQRTIEGAAEH